MTLRARIVWLVAVVTTATVAAVGIVVYRAADAELTQEVDLDLLNRSRQLVGPGRIAFGGPDGVDVDRPGFGRPDLDSAGERLERVVSSRAPWRSQVRREEAPKRRRRHPTNSLHDERD